MSTPQTDLRSLSGPGPFALAAATAISQKFILLRTREEQRAMEEVFEADGAANEARWMAEHGADRSSM